jgi:hypothetical protein
MKKSLLALVALGAAVDAVHAQVLTIPDTQNTFNAGTSGVPFSVGRRQFIYDTSHFTAAGVTGPITINTLRFRGQDGVKNLGGNVYTGVIAQLGTAAVDYLTMSTTFATNRGVMGLPTAPLTITTQPLSGAWTNDTWITIDLAANGAAFTYDPTLGQDLLVELQIPTAPVPATNLPATACSSTTANGRAQRLSATTLTATTGALSGFASVIELDFAGPGGYSAPTGSWVENRGAGCGQQAQSFYQFTSFIGDSFGLRNGRSLTMIPDNPTAPSFYVVSGGTTLPDLSPAALGPNAPNTGDDGIIVETPGYTFNFPGGSTTVFNVDLNGAVFLGTGLSDNSPTVLEFRNTTARLAAAWFDHHCGRNITTNPGSGLYVNTDLSGGPGNGVTYVTWNQTGQFNAAQPGANVNTFQIVIQESGIVEFRYGAMDGMLGNAVLTGFSRGGTSAAPCVDPGNRDLEVDNNFVTMAEGTFGAMTLGPSARPYLSVPSIGPALNLTHTVSNIPAGQIAVALLVDFGAFAPGIPLALSVAPGCLQTVIAPAMLDITFAPATASWTTLPLTLPLGTSANAGGWMGAALYTQAVSLDGTTGETRSSNALKLNLGLL